nr:hypothetical protein Iba_chr02fCG3140 [Ipomoea batatas]
MIPEDMESLKKAQRSEKASMEKPVQKEYNYFGITYHEAEVEAENEVGGDRNSGELNIANMAGESLGDNHHGIRRDSGEDGGSYYVP